MPTTQEVLETIYAAYREKRLDAMLALLADDFKFTLHLPLDTLPGSGLPNSKDEAAASFRAIFETYDFLDYDPGPIQVSPAGDEATAAPRVRFRHIATGEVIQTQLAHVWRLSGGKATSLDEYHDASRVEAFRSQIKSP